MGGAREVVWMSGVIAVGAISIGASDVMRGGRINAGSVVEHTSAAFCHWQRAQLSTVPNVGTFALAKHAAQQHPMGAKNSPCPPCACGNMPNTAMHR